MKSLWSFSRPVIRVVLLAALASTCAYAQEDSYPNKPVRLVVPFAAGGGNDIINRYIGQRLAERIGQPVLIDNRVGADGMIGTEFVSRAAPDGYTLLAASTSYTTNAAIHKLSYDPVKALTGIAQIGSGPLVIATFQGLPVNSVKELIALAKSKPGQLNYATSGVGGVNNFGGELFNIMAGVRMTHIPYKGGGQAVTDVMSGQAQVLVSTLIQAIPQIRSGKLKALGVGSEKRSSLLPDVPTVAEAGVPGYEGSIWWGIMAPAAIAAPIANRLNVDMGQILREPETVKRLSNEGADPVVVSREVFSRMIISDIAKWARIAREAGIKAE